MGCGEELLDTPAPVFFQDQPASWLHLQNVYEGLRSRAGRQALLLWHQASCLCLQEPTSQELRLELSQPPRPLGSGGIQCFGSGGCDSDEMGIKEHWL